MIKESKLHKKSFILWLLILASAVLITIQILIFIPKLLPFISHTNAPSLKLPIQLKLEILLCIIIQISIWVMLSILVWLITITNGMVLNLSDKKISQLAILLWSVAVLTIFCFNQLYFPKSTFSIFSATLIPQTMLKYIISANIIVLCFSICISAYYVIKKHSYISLIILFISLVMIFTVLRLNNFSHKNNTASSVQPNIILIGIDGLRPDFISNHAYAKLNTIKNFIDQAINFKDAYTPIGRTFGAWVSILTGLYPSHSGARLDLTPKSLINTHASLAYELKKDGYTTIYGTDEKRFSNIDKDYGFDELIGPKIGANDFVLGVYNDFPISNLISITPLGKWLFPYNFVNRAAAHIYYPEQFTSAVKKTLQNKIANQPVFLALHLCLPHWPYIWANSDITQAPNNKKNLLKAYIASLNEVDNQLKNILHVLKQQGLLHHAIIVLLSDHGENLGLSEDRYIIKHEVHSDKINKKKLNDKSISHLGHGTDVLSSSQSHVVLSFQFIGIKKPSYNNKIDLPASLIDIKPTILNYLKLKSNQKTDGVNLFSNDTSSRPIFIETGFNPKEALKPPIALTKLLNLARDYYQVSQENGYVSLKQDKRIKIISNKQLAALDENHMIALYPKKNAYDVLFINRQDHFATQLSDLMINHKTTQSLLRSLCDFYKLHCLKKKGLIYKVLR